MVRLHKLYRDKGFEILAFPCDMGQEPNSDEEIQSFARELYGAEFPIFKKDDVNGSGT